MNMSFFRNIYKLLTIATFLCAHFCGSNSSSASDICLKDARNIRVDGSNVIRFRDYLCQTSAGAVSVQFHRLNDFAASALIHHTLPPRLKKLFGNAHIHKNDVYREFSLILNKYGIDQEYEPFLSISTPAGDNLDHAAAGNIETIPIIFNIQDDGKFVDFPQPDAIYSLIKKGKRPSAYRRFPGGMIWKYMTRDEANNYSRLVTRLNRLVSRDFISRDYSGRTAEVPKTVSLIKYLTKYKWPKDFVVIIGRSGSDAYGCIDTPWEFHFFERLPILDVAVIENKSDRAVRVEALFGARSSTHALRPQSQTRRLRKAGARRIANDFGRLGSREKVVVPTRITFASNDALKALFRRKSSNKPRFTNYVFGPEIAITGVQISGRRFDLEGGSANYLALTSSCECGSCPYLYSWDQIAGRWLSHGKVIHTAKGKDRETIETRALNGLVTKFRLAEEEAELAYINKVELTLELKGGSKIRLMPEKKSLRSTDGDYTRIYFGQSIEIDFKVPKWIRSSDVDISKFTIVGYYVRYGDLFKRSRSNFSLSPILGSAKVQ